MAALQTAFIRIVKHYRFCLSKEMANEIELMENKTNDKGKKCVIGIHFHEKCSLQNGKIIKLVKPQYTM